MHSNSMSKPQRVTIPTSNETAIIPEIVLLFSHAYLSGPESNVFTDSWAVFDTMFVASSDKEWVQSPIEI